MGVDDDLGARNDDDGDAEGAEGADASPTSPRSAAIAKARRGASTQSAAKKTAIEVRGRWEFHRCSASPRSCSRR